MNEIEESKQKKKKKAPSKKFSIPPNKYFLQDKKYSAFNTKGIPTHYKDGSKLNDKARKKLLKFLVNYTKKYCNAHR